MQGTPVQSLGWEDATCHGGLLSLGVPQSLSLHPLEPVLCNKRSHCNEAIAVYTACLRAFAHVILSAWDTVSLGSYSASSLPFCLNVTSSESSDSVLFSLIGFVTRFPGFVYSLIGLPRWLHGKESACHAEVPRSGGSPGEGNGNPLQCSCLGNPMDRGACPATVHEVTKESAMT